MQAPLAQIYARPTRHAAARGKLLGGIVGKLAAIDPALISEPEIARGVEQVRWAGVDLAVRVVPGQPLPSVAIPLEPGFVTLGRPLAPHPPARRTPSTAPPVPCSLGEVIELGPRIVIRGKPDMEAVDDAIFPVRGRVVEARLIDAKGV